jgi:hypothetical protein
MVELYLQNTQKILVLIILFFAFPVITKAQEYSCDTLERVFNNNDRLGRSFESSSEPVEGFEKFVKRKNNVEKINPIDWDTHCKKEENVLNVRISFFVLPLGKAICFVPLDTVCVELNELAIKFLSETKFKPAKRNGTAVVDRNSYPFVFKRQRRS